MRKLHPISPHETAVSHGAFRHPDGVVESWTVHAAPPDRHVVRVEAAGDAGAELWHLMLGADGRPERLQARVREGGRTLDATYTFFEDEVLVWRKGGQPASEAIALPPGYRLLWPPAAGRELCLGADGAEGEREETCFVLERETIAEGGLRGRAVTFTVHTGPRSIALSAPGRPELRAELDESERLMRWIEGDRITELEDHE